MVKTSFVTLIILSPCPIDSIRLIERHCTKKEALWRRSGCLFASCYEGPGFETIEVSLYNGRLKSL